MNSKNEVETKYKLYRTVKEILHPTISKRNISNYRIIFSEELLPVQIFYPKKITTIENVIVFIHGNGEITECNGLYSTICKNFSLKTNSLLISIDYDDEKETYRKLVKELAQVIKHIYEGLLDNHIEKERIILMGDSTAAGMIREITKTNQNIIKKEILFYPTLSLEYFGKTKYQSIIQNQELNFNLIPKLKRYYTKLLTKKDIEMNHFNHIKKEEKIPKTLLFVGTVDCLKDEVQEYANIHSKECTYIEMPFLSHGFLKRLEPEEEKIIIERIIDFIKK